MRDRETVYRKATNMIDDWIVGVIEETLKDNIKSFCCLKDQKKISKGILESLST